MNDDALRRRRGDQVLVGLRLVLWSCAVAFAVVVALAAWRLMH